jgi:two-component system OmpR family response regulator
MALLQQDGKSLTSEDLALRQFLTVGRLRLDRYHHIAWLGEERHELTRQEFLLLEVLMQNSPRAVARDVILERAWNVHWDTRTNVVDVYIRYLRQKLGPHMISTHRGVGYRITA